MVKLKKVRENYLLIMILFLAVVLRIIAAVFLGDNVDELPGIHDQISYNALAQNLLRSNGYSFDNNWYPFTPANTPTSHWSFIYPAYLAMIYYLFGSHPLVARLVQGIVGGVMISLLLYLIGRRIFDKYVGLIAAAIAAVYVYYIYYNVALMTETFFIVAMLLSIYICLEIYEKPTLRRWFALGIVVGFAVLLRQTVLFILPIFLLWLLWKLRGQVRVRHLIIPLLLVILFIIPWTVRNYMVFNQFLLLNSNSGYALYASNNPNLGNKWDSDKVVIPIPDELAGLNEAEIDRALLKLSIQYVIEDPVRYSLLTLSKVPEYFKFWPTSQSSTISNVSRVLSFGLFLPFMVWGITSSISNWKKYIILYMFALGHTIIYLLSWPAPRYRLPVDAILILFAGFALYNLANRFDFWNKTKTIFQI